MSIYYCDTCKRFHTAPCKRTSTTPPLDPTPASLRTDQRLRAEHLVKLADGCPYCLIPALVPVCPDCYRCVRHGAGCDTCRGFRKPAPGAR